MRRPTTRLIVVASAAALVLAACGRSEPAADTTTSAAPTTTAASTTTAAPDTTKPKPPNAQLDSDQIKTIQTELTTVGCFDGKVDGVIGPATRGGIERFQAAEKIAVDGQAGPVTRAKLTETSAAKKTVCTAPTTTTTTKPQSAPCTVAAILPAVKAGPSGSNVQGITDYGCDGGWAYAGVDIGGEAGYETVELLKQNGTGWQVVDRGANCKPNIVPASIFNTACTTS